ncbi:MAG: DUF2079 domain-containing protein [Oculatellaceae cyanobacterium Prado106]|jgi:uncharacterized membrane protein|nr:DUF2079 domain-containing protein [Oculatellaceae cyanobacterium Prado106]
MNFLRKTSPLRGVIIIAVLFWMICTALVLQRYYTFFPTFVAFDQGIFNQVFWNNLHGRWFEGSLSSTESVAVMQGNLPEVDYHRLGQHFTPALSLWTLWYAVFPSAAGLSVLQVTLITAAGLVLYALARHYHPPKLAAMITASYYGAIALISPTLANFHDICQIPLFAFGLFWALEKRRWWLVGLLSVLILMVREDSGVVLFGIGFYCVASRRFPRIGVALSVLSLVYMLALTNLIMPLFSNDLSDRFMIEQFGQFTDGQSASTLDVIWGILSNPLRLIQQLLTPPEPTVRYLLGQWLPLAFVPIISMDAWMLAGFPILKTLIQNDPSALSLHLRYAQTWVPGLFYGMILWWSRHPQLFKPRFRQIWIGCICLSLIFTITANPNRALSWLIPDSIQPWVYVSPARQWQHAQAVRSLLAQIPPDASVTATDHIVAHVSGRREVLRFPLLKLRNDAEQEQLMEYAIADLWYLQQSQPAFEDYRKTLEANQQAIARILRRRFGGQRYGLIDFQDGVLLMQWGKPSNPEAVANWEAYRQTLPRS